MQEESYGEEDADQVPQNASEPESVVQDVENQETPQTEDTLNNELNEL